MSVSWSGVIKGCQNASLGAICDLPIMFFWPVKSYFKTTEMFATDNLKIKIETS